MTAEPAEVASRTDRRRQRTRAALLSAAQGFLADGRTNVSIQQITDAADVGFGSFYNHFESKDALFEAAVAEVLDTYAGALDQIVAGYDDPAEVFAVSFRTTARLQREAPQMVRILLNEGTAVLLRDAGLAGRARADLTAAATTRRFDIDDVELALMTAGGALLGVLQLLDAHPEADAGRLADQMTARVLRAFGLSKDAAGELCARPLPGPPALRPAEATP
ncbi:TetR/AcrR family transcriptional regulator [Skermania piniformis]|uniref:TetR/AcrR family transcriptional regulator n=1 Tax=Skermania pinensis TaxID=39122 RepID=A0ABX8SAR1_9ACTN|nr:TetR/AcrR family transcriptional regulator [Skermania piniformis]QXQ14262.1 TetR/AcrR family transcriptional regulator [Skermania piniformis]